MLSIIGTLLGNDSNHLFIQPQAHNILHIYFKELENMIICFALQLFQNILLLYSSTETIGPILFQNKFILEGITSVAMIEEAQ